jgi:hypothetical protein
MKPITPFEKIIICLVLSIGLLGGVALILMKMPPIIPSIFIAMAISTLVFYFLGGIEQSNFNMGPVKLSGSIAALIGSAFFINWQLADQQTNPEIALLPDSRLYVICNDSKTVGKLSVHSLSLTEDNFLLLNDSVRLGQLDLRGMKLDNHFMINTRQEVKLGEIAPGNLKDLGLFNEMKSEGYMEVSYTIELGEGLTSTIGFGDSRLFRDQYQGDYEDLPFTVQPVLFSGRNRGNGLRTLIAHKNPAGEPINDVPLAGGQNILVSHLDDYIYLIRTRSANTSDDTRPYFVQYQIIAFSRILKTHNL